MATEDREAIKGGELIVTGRLVDASNATLFGHVKRSTGTEISVIYKPVAGERPLWDFPDRTLAAREVAAYLFSEFAGFHVVPFTVLRDGPFGIGAVQEWIDIDESIDIIEMAQSRNESLRKLVIFDAIINNTDRKMGHLLPTLTGELLACDHGVCFHQEDKLRTVLWQWRAEEFAKSEMELLSDIRDRFSIFVPTVEELLTPEEIEATQMRLTRLIDSGIFPVPSEDWPAIPWPPI
jgi:uncharacterized repeat protein (TIGR03843 family)